MTNNLFKHVAVFTDIHVGLKHNSQTHNKDCIDFIDWFIDEAKSRGAETCIFMGDFHHHRATLNVCSLGYTMRILGKLNQAFEHVWFIVGNHDIYYREKRDVNSIPMAELYPNITLVDKPMIKDNVAIVPWLVGDEWKEVKEYETKYMFGHFELPGFKLNAMVDMPDHGGLNKTHFKNQEYVFSGHFHKRQFGENVHYIGNPFGHNYADAWDFDRGAMFLKWGGKPEYVNWTDGPKYMSTKLSCLADEPEKYLLPKAHIKAVIDVDLSYEEVNYMRETLIEQFNIRELKLLPSDSLRHTEDTELEISFESVDEIVVSQINSIESDEYNIERLVDIYNNLCN